MHQFKEELEFYKECKKVLREGMLDTNMYTY